MSELSKQMMVTGGSVTVVSRAMEKAGYIRRELDKTDQRIWRLRLTDRGHSYLQDMASTHTAWLTKTFDSFPSKKRRVLLGLLDSIEGRL